MILHHDFVSCLALTASSLPDIFAEEVESLMRGLEAIGLYQISLGPIALPFQWGATAHKLDHQRTSSTRTAPSHRL